MYGAEAEDARKLHKPLVPRKEDIGELGDIIHGFGCWDYREMRYFKTTKEGRMGYGGKIDGYINEGKEIGLESSIKPLITNRLLTKEQIAKVYWG